MDDMMIVGRGGGEEGRVWGKSGEDIPVVNVRETRWFFFSKGFTFFGALL
jgi:hypothetical protein